MQLYHSSNKSYTIVAIFEKTKDNENTKGDKLLKKCSHKLLKSQQRHSQSVMLEPAYFFVLLLAMQQKMHQKILINPVPPFVLHSCGFPRLK